MEKAQENNILLKERLNKLENDIETLISSADKEKNIFKKKNKRRQQYNKIIAKKNN